MDPHKILDVRNDATLEEIQRAYRKKATKHHPDHGGDAWAFQQVSEAYEQLVEGCEAGPQRGRPRRPAADPPPGDRHAAAPEKTRDAPRGAAAESSGFMPRIRSLWQSPPHTARLIRDRLWKLAATQLPLQSETTFFILVNVLDIIVTYLLIRTGGVEANPIARFFLERWGIDGMIFYKMAIVAFVAVVTQAIAPRNLPAARGVLQLGTLVVGIVVVYGIMLLLGQ